jgi:hypothetical protein
MLSSKSFGNNTPPSTEKTVKAKILKPIFVAGEAREVGATASMSLSDAEALQSVGRVEIL